MPTPNFTTNARQLAYENLVWLVRRHVITSTVFQREKAKLVTRQNKSDALAEKKYQEKLKKQEEKRISKAFTKKFVKDLNKNKKVSYSILDVDNVIGFANFVKLVVEQGKNLIVTIGDISWVVNQYTQSKLLRLINDEITTAELHEESWGAFILHYKDMGKTITVSEWNNTNTYKQETGAFFKYYHKTSFNLSRYGIYALGEEAGEYRYTQTCLVDALLNAGLPQQKVFHLKNCIVNRVIPKCKLNTVCDLIKSKIILKQHDPKNGHTKTVYGKQYETTYHIGLIEDHYLVVEPTEITTRFALENYHAVCDKKDFHKIYRQHNQLYKRCNDRFLDSFDIVKVLLEQKDKLLKEMSISDQYIASTQFYDKVSDVIDDLDYDPALCLPIQNKEQKEDKDNFVNIVFDFECGFNQEIHVPYVVCIYSDKYNKTFYGYDCGIQMLAYLNSLKINVRLIAHNATYDYRFLIHHIRDITELSRGNRMISLKGKFGSSDNFMKIEIKDSYHLISMGLKDFPKVFGLTDCKEVMPYKLYTKENIDKKFINVDYVLKNYIKENDKQHFLDNLNKWNLINGDDYDIIEYSARYCQIDCKILWEGYNIFRKWMIDCVDIDIDNKLTIASLAHTYMINQGCYDGIYQLSGVPQMFIQRAVIGGRTMVANNSRYNETVKMNDFDAVSLYPSAMARMDGFLKGLPKIITNTDYNWLKNQDGFFVEIEITSVGIERAFPLVSYKNDEQIRIFSNDMVGKKIIIDKISLEDLLQFQKVTFNVIRGYYFNEGFNTKVNETIKYLFNARQQKKDEKNPVEIIYKLIMNSGYGKSIMKAVETESKFFDDEKAFKVFVSRNYNSCTTFSKFGNKFKVKIIKPISDHSNICQVGTMILAWSKRIMNEVICTAEDNGIFIYYQDTDSLHIKDQDIEKLSNIFKEKYGRELIGKNMGQFHSDFEIKYEKNGKQLKCKNVIARRSIFLGKKSYIDELEGIDVDGNTIIEYHARMKGIPPACLDYAVEKQGLDNLYELYQMLWNGTAIKVDLTNDGEKANFKFMPNYECKTLSFFERTILFADHDTKKKFKKDQQKQKRLIHQI
jgi:hypothetical protein